MQADRSVAWIGWWSLYTVSQRVIIVWLYNNTGKSVFATALFPMMTKVSWQMFPVNRSYFDPFIFSVFVFIIAAFVTVLCGAKTLSRYRFA